MPTPLTERDHQLLRELYGESSASLSLGNGIRALHEGRTADAVVSILSPFSKLITGYLPRKRKIWLYVS